MVLAAFITAALLYTVSCGLYLTFLARGTSRSGVWATRVLGGAAASHVGFLLTDYGASGNIPYGDIHQTLSLASLLIILAYLLAHARFKVRVLGAFITPVTLLFFVGAGVGTRVPQVPSDVRSALLPIHIGVNVLGIVAFTLAFATALAYLIQERLLREKRIGGLFQRLPPLDQLDSLGFRLVTLGFPLLTVGVVTGTLVAARLAPGTLALTPTQGLAVASWLVFAGVLLLRVAAGWRGRRAAVGTLVGFVCAALVLLGYLIRAGNAG